MRNNKRWWLAALTAAGILTTTPTYSLPIDWFDGEVTGSFDSTITAGVGIRMEKRDPKNVSLFSGGNYPSSNEDDGNLNYDQYDVYSAAIKSNHELELFYKDWSGFSRFTLLYDVDVMHGSTQRTPLGKTVEGRLGRSARLLDLYVQRDESFGEQSLSVRVGKQVLNWGESTFIQNGMNVINPIDVAKLRTAGSEVRDALLPVPMIRVDYSFNDQLSMLAFWQWHWEETALDPKGSFFSTNDFVSPGSTFATITNGATTDINPGLGTFAARGPDRDPYNTHNGGVAFRYYSPDLNNTEFGVYAAIYASRLPVISAQRNTSVLDSFYFKEYPNHILLLGASFNTMWKEIAFQGEYSLKVGQPIQIDDAQLLAATLGLAPTQISAGAVPNFTEIKGWRRKNVSQMQVTATKNFGPVWKSDETIGVIEAGLTMVHDMEAKHILHYEAPGTPYGHGYADHTAAGYRVLLRNQFNNAIGPVSLTTTQAFSHDLFGTLPSPITVFVKDRMQVSSKIEARYFEWSGELQYTYFFGGGVHNLLRDRNFLTFSASYAF